MAGRWTHSEKQLRPDPRYGDKVLSKFINCIMHDGQKAPATRTIYDAMAIIEDRLAKETAENKPSSALELFHLAINNCKPYVEVRSKRVGGANYQVPMQVKDRRKQSLAFRWLIEAARGEKGRPFANRIADELYAAAKGEGKAMGTREQVHKMAEANKAFAHYAN